MTSPIGNRFSSEHVSRRGFLKQTATLAVGSLAGTALANQTGSNTRAAVQTVLGRIAPEKLGVTLMHEHVPIVDWSELYETPVGPVEPIREEMLATSVRLLERFHKTLNEANGPGAIVECTPIRVGRYPRLLVELAKRTPVRIIACTGFWGEGLAPAHPWASQLAFGKNGARKIADLYIREITEGMEDPSGEWGEKFTRIQAGIIKCATSSYLRPTERRCHLAAAIAGKETGCPITTHTTNGGGLEELGLFLKQGVDPEKVIIGHQGNKDDRQSDDAHEYHRRIVSTGCNIQFDRIGMKAYSPRKTATQIKRLIDAGFAKQILVSHDVAPYYYKDFTAEKKSADGWKSEEADYTVVTTQLLDELKKLDVSKTDIRTILVENPRRVLAF